MTRSWPRKASSPFGSPCQTIYTRLRNQGGSGEKAAAAVALEEGRPCLGPSKQRSDLSFSTPPRKAPPQKGRWRQRTRHALRATSFRDGDKSADSRTNRIRSSWRSWKRLVRLQQIQTPLQLKEACGR